MTDAEAEAALIAMRDVFRMQLAIADELNQHLIGAALAHALHVIENAIDN